MSTITKGSFSLNLGLVQLSGDLSDDDRQCAWELYTEITTRVAVVGKGADKTATNFDGELYSESLDSLYTFFRECRGIMRRFPVGRIKDIRQEHLGVLIHRILTNVIRPFLEKWNGQYRAWWMRFPRPGVSDYDAQKCFPEHRNFIADWIALRLIMRQVQLKLAQEYKLIPLE